MQNRKSSGSPGGRLCTVSVVPASRQRCLRSRILAGAPPTNTVSVFEKYP